MLGGLGTGDEGGNDLPIAARAALEDIVEDAVEFVEEHPGGVKAESLDVFFGGDLGVDLAEIAGDTSGDADDIELFTETDTFVIFTPEKDGFGEREGLEPEVPRAATDEAGGVENVLLDPRGD